MPETKPLLFEIGTEELPPKALKKLANVLHRQLIANLKKQNLIDSSAQSKVFATPRRLAVFVDNVLESQPDQTIAGVVRQSSRPSMIMGNPQPLHWGLQSLSDLRCRS